jgi:hypothetical protein
MLTAPRSDITHLGSQRGSVASEPLHLQGLVLLWNVLLLLLLLQGFCCLGQASTSSFCILTTNRKHNDWLRGASTRTTFCHQVLQLFTIHCHRRAPRLARNVLQGLKRIDCDPYASDSVGKGKCDRLCQTPGLVKSCAAQPTGAAEEGAGEGGFVIVAVSGCSWECLGL